MLRFVALVELRLCWLLWILAFVKPHKLAAGKQKVVRAPASRWGIVLVTVDFALVWVYVRPVDF